MPRIDLTGSSAEEPPPKIWQVLTVPCVDRIVLELSARLLPGCQGFVVDGFEDYLFLNASPAPGDQQIYDVVFGGLRAQERFFLDFLEIKLRDYDSLCMVRTLATSLLRRGDKSNGCLIDVIVETPEEHRLRGDCPFWC